MLNAGNLNDTGRRQRNRRGKGADHQNRPGRQRSQNGRNHPGIHIIDRIDSRQLSICHPFGDAEQAGGKP